MNDTLILTFDASPKDFRLAVYRHTLKYISERLEKVHVCHFESNEKLLALIDKKHFSTVISTNEIARETAVLLKGMGIVQVLLGFREDLVKAVDIIIDPLLAKDEKYLVGTRFLLPSVLNVAPAKDVADLLGISEEDLREDVACNEAESELLHIVRLFQKLEWDSQFFGMNVGFISCLRLTENIERHISKFLRREKIDLLEYLCNCHGRESVLVLERNGYSFVDIRLTFERSLHDPVVAELRSGFEVRKAEPKDVEDMKRIGTDIYKHSRYYFDVNFDRKKVVEFYQGWIEKAVYGQFDDFAYVLVEKDKPLGFCTIKKFGRRSARFNLVGVDGGRSGNGLGKALIENALKKLREEENIIYAEVVTQGRNYVAQRLYQRSGFVTKMTELWYHKWFC